MTQEALAERVGVSIPTLGKLEAGAPSTSLATVLRARRRPAPNGTEASGVAGKHSRRGARIPRRRATDCRRADDARRAADRARALAHRHGSNWPRQPEVAPRGGGTLRPSARNPSTWKAIASAMRRLLQCSPASRARRTLASVAAARSSLGFPATVTRPGRLGCELPMAATGRDQHPAFVFQHAEHGGDFHARRVAREVIPQHRRTPPVRVGGFNPKLGPLPPAPKRDRHHPVTPAARHFPTQTGMGGAASPCN